jgi:hypothetical protein
VSRSTFDRVAECEHGVREPPMSLPAILHPLCLTKLAAHRGHRIGEIRDRLANVAALEFAEHLVPVLDGGHLTQRLIEQPRHAIVGIPLAHRWMMSPSRKSWKQSGGASASGGASPRGNRTLVKFTPFRHHRGIPPLANVSQLPIYLVAVSERLSSVSGGGHAGRGGVVFDDDESGTRLTALQV